MFEIEDFSMFAHTEQKRRIWHTHEPRVFPKKRVKPVPPFGTRFFRVTHVPLTEPAIETDRVLRINRFVEHKMSVRNSQPMEQMIRLGSARGSREEKVVTEVFG